MDYVSQMGVNDNVIVLGDFNLRGIIWQCDSSGSFFPDSSCSSLSLASRKLLDAYNTAGLKQLNSVRNNNDRVLDLCFASEDICPDCSVIRAPSHLVKDVLHHPPLLLTAEIKPQLQFNDTTSQIFYDFSKADYDGMNVFLRNLDWTQILNGADANRSASLFSSILIYAISQFVPQKTQRKPTQPAWSNAHLKSLKRSKRAALRKHSKYRTDATRSAYAQANELYTRLNDRLYRAHQVEIQNSLKSNPKSFWRYVNDQRKQTGLPTSMTNGVDLEVSSVTGIADLFRSQFSSVFTNEILPTEDIDKVVRNVPHLSSPSLQVPVTSNMVINALDKLKCSTGFGPDCIPSVLLKKCSDSLAAPLAAIFNLSITSGEYPTCWKDSFVFPVHKKGDKRNVSNYRGIAALSATSKLFELIVLDKLVQTCAHYISVNQHGFMPKRSTTTNLTILTNFIVREMEKGNQVDAIYTDLSAAFDKMNHEIALAKFKKLGFDYNSLKWLRSYLIGRSMSVKIGDHVSPSFPVSSGVPQGSHLGPLLFLLYMNDVNFVLDCLTLSYADDLKLYYVIKHPNDAVFLQQQLQIFANWCRLNRMLLNVSKCLVISFGRKALPFLHDYCLDNTNLKRETTVKDLGILLDSKLTFKDHVSYIVSKASSQLGFIFRFAKQFKDIYCLKSLYCALVRPILEYSAVVWSPYYQNENQRLESIQRKFVRFALRFLNWRNPYNLPSYKSRCMLINLELLQARRELAKACFIADLVQNHIDCPALLSMIDFNIRRRSLRSHSFLHLRFSSSNYGQNEPLRSMCRVFNKCFNV